MIEVPRFTQHLERIRHGLHRAGGAVTLRRVLLVLALAVGLSTIALGSEALIRAHIPGAAARMPTTLYTRPSPWEGDDADSTPVAIGTVDGAPLESRVPVSLKRVPPQLIDAVLAVEDQRFYQHHGLDLKRIIGAFVADVRAGAITQGGSTLTQQLAKNLFLTARRTPLRKLREAAFALVLEARYDKATILDAYLNEIYLGQDGARAIHGVGAAARYYFGKSVQHLTLDECAELAGMISAPNRTDPSRHAEAARDRRNTVLALMAEQGRITQARARRAEHLPIETDTHPSSELDARYFRDYVRGDLPRHLGARGDAVYTTLDANLQRAAVHAVRRGTARLSAIGAQAALVAIDPRTGDVLAMVGGRDYSTSQFNRAADAHRQPGSAFKPIVAAAALAPRGERPPQFTLASVVEDEPLQVNTNDGPWQPTDYDQEYRGPVTVRTAMEESLNIPFARIGLAVGSKRIVETAHRLGIESELDAVPSIALGSSEVTLLELTRAYGVFADHGILAPSRTVFAVQRRSDRSDIVTDTTMHGTPVMNPAVAFLVTSALQGVVQHGTGRAVNQYDGLEHLAGKTGTSNNWRDAWFVAYTPTLVVGVWVGYDDGRSLHLTGSAAALPIAASFLSDVAPDGGWDDFDEPDGITEATIATPGDFDWGCGRQEVFLDGTQPDDAPCETWDFPVVRELRNWGAKAGDQAERSLRALILRKLEAEGIHIRIQ